MRFTVDKDILACFPGMKLAVVVARGIDNRPDRPAIRAELAQAWQQAGQAAAACGNPQSHPAIVPWVERFKALGVSRKEFPTSIEALVRRAGKGGEPFAINPLVDFYNAVSLRHLVPAGGFDLDQLAAGLQLRFTRAGDTFQALDEAAPGPVPAGEIAYADGPDIITRHFVWRQARHGLIRPESGNVLLISEIPGEVGEGVAPEVLAALAAGVRAHFGVLPAARLLDAANLAMEL